nr:YheV family putative zinc ribbon protein [Shewanella halifaxensis]
MITTNTTKKVKKRFVAGAKCPKCQAKESIVLFKENGIETVECVECDYREQQTEKKVTKKATGAVIGVFNPD